uniref:Uncharacterized protein n=1 Tax=Tanacetum cinerariifolium TaxID=118510 RepID=A0A6L2ML06_TANCI|nr:hypothetical protein [Tanacetum cinerariifolium]
MPITRPKRGLGNVFFANSQLVKDLSFFLTNKTGAPQGEELGLINPLSGARATGTTPGTRSIWNSTGRAGRIPSKSSGKTSGKSLTIGTSSSRLPSDLSLASFVFWAILLDVPYVTIFIACSSSLILVVIIVVVVVVVVGIDPIIRGTMTIPDEGPSIEERALLFLKAQDRVKEKAKKFRDA